MNRDSAVLPLAALKRRCSDPRGFALTEAIAAAAVLAFLALGVLAGLDGAASSTGREKSRAVASGLAEKDQERLHAMRAVDLPELRETNVTEVNDASYTVKSEADWISDSTGGTVSCTSNGGTADYLRLRSIVTSETVGKRTAPVQIESLVAPPIGSAGGNNGTLAVQVKDRDDVGVQSMNVKVVGANTGHTQTEPTNELGCAIFPLIPADSYDISVNQVGWVDPGGVTDVHVSDQVNTGSTSLQTIVYDRAGKMKTGFDTRWWDPRAVAAKTTASTAWWLAAENTGVPGGMRKFRDTSGPQLTLEATGLFPFKDGYGVHTGPCPEENPRTVDVPWSDANAFQLVDPGVTYDRTASPAMPLRQPALPLRIAYDGLPVGDANVVAKLIPPSPTSKCKDAEVITGLQSYPTDRPPTASHPRSGIGPTYANGLAGMVTKPPTTSREYDPGLPFGKWQVCADIAIKVSKWNWDDRRAFATVDNTATGSPPTIYVLDLNDAPTAQDGDCPTTGTSSEWPATS